MTQTTDTVFQLIRKSLGSKIDVNFSLGVSCASVIETATEQGVLGLCFDAIELLPVEKRPDIDNLMEWLGQVEYQKTLYDEHKKAIKELSHFYSSNGIKMMLLKGYGLSLYWPKPEHRPVGDIDIYNFGLWQFADQMVEDKLKIQVGDVHEHHTTFSYNGILVENHYDFIDTKAHQDAIIIEKKLKELAERSCRECKIDDETFFTPSPDFNAIFLLQHLGDHFGGSHITLRQVLDWGFFMQHEHDNITWTEIIPFMKEMGLWKFFNQINAICVDYLGFSFDRLRNQIPEIERDAKLEERILNDIFDPKTADIDRAKSTINVIGQKTVRFFRNSWKRKLVYKESLLSQLWYGSIAHLRRFDTIKD